MTEQFHEIIRSANLRYRIAVEQAWRVYRDTVTPTDPAPFRQGLRFGYRGSRGASSGSTPNKAVTAAEHAAAWHEYRVALVRARVSHEAELATAQDVCAMTKI